MPPQLPFFLDLSMANSEFFSFLEDLNFVELEDIFAEGNFLPPSALPTNYLESTMDKKKVEELMAKHRMEGRGLYCHPPDCTTSLVGITSLSHLSP